VLWGSAVYDLGPRRIVLGPGSELWLAPGQKHTLIEVSDDLAMWVSSFREDPVRIAEWDSGVQVLDQAATWGACVLSPARLHGLSALCSELVIRGVPHEFNPVAHQLLVEALGAWQEHGYAGRHASSNPTGGLHPGVERAVALLRRVEGDLTLEQVARRCCLSAPRLSRVFKQQMGLSLGQYRTHQRVQRFIAEFGRGEGQNMLEVALLVGFGSYSQFHRAFWQVTGYAPSEHLRRVRAGVVVPIEQGRQAKPAGPAAAG
jgi:AraC-like DNA-binding protein